jgi:hypothetical protein
LKLSNKNKNNSHNQSINSDSVVPPIKSTSKINSGINLKKMKAQIILLLLLLISTPCLSKEYKEYTFFMSLGEEYAVQETDDIKIEVQRELTLRYADVKVTPKNDDSFNMMLYFKSDTEDLSQFDTPAKIQNSVIRSSRKYLPYVVEKDVKLLNVDWKGQYGSYCILTDSDLASAKTIPPKQFKYLTRGMVRLSKDSVLGFSLMTNEIDSDKYNELLAYIQRFIK